jgi:hypothetical protein
MKIQKTSPLKLKPHWIGLERTSTAIGFGFINFYLEYLKRFPKILLLLQQAACMITNRNLITKPVSKNAGEFLDYGS